LELSSFSSVSTEWYLTATSQERILQDPSQFINSQHIIRWHTVWDRDSTVK